MAKTLTTKRLLLRAMTAADTDALLEYHSDPRTVDYIPWPVRSREDVVTAIEAYEKGPALLVNEGDYYTLGWAINDGGPNTGKIIGQSNISLKSNVHHTGDIGWVTHPQFVRQGYAYEATLALMAYAFEAFALHRITATIDARNTGSALLAEKLGMRREAHFKSAEFFKGEWCDMLVYAMLKDEFDTTY